MAKQENINEALLKNWVNDNLDGDAGLNVASVAANELIHVHTHSFEQDLSKKLAQYDFLCDIEGTIQGLALLHQAVRQSQRNDSPLEDARVNEELKQRVDDLLGNAQKTSKQL